VNLFRRLSTLRLLALCASVVVLGLVIAAVAAAVGDDAEPPPPKPLAVAIHDAASARPVEGVTARIELTNNLVEANGFHGISPLVAGGEGRLWWSREGSLRIELQGGDGDAQLVLDGRDFWAYDGASNTAWRGTLPPPEEGERHEHRVPTVAQIERKLADAAERAAIAGPDPGVDGGQPSYFARVTPASGGGLLGGVGLAWDAVRGTPLRAAVYAKGRGEPVLELKATEVEYGLVDGAAFGVEPPPGAEVRRAGGQEGSGQRADSHARPKRLSGRGAEAIWLVKGPAKEPSDSDSGSDSEPQLELPTTDVNGSPARVLETPLGTAVEWSRDGVTYVVAGFVPRASVEAAARAVE
jgi:hypothetical protein